MATAEPTSYSVSNGHLESRPERSGAGAVANRSTRPKSGTSATPTKTARSTGARSTRAATSGAPAKKRTVGVIKKAARPAAKAETGSSGPVAAAVESELADLATVHPKLAASALAASALALAREMDTSGNSATSKSMCAKALLDTLDRLRELTPPEQKADALDDLSARRAARRANSAS